jgi:hypothetical protein
VALFPGGTQPRDRQFRRIDLMRRITGLNDGSLLGIGLETYDGSWLVAQATSPQGGDVDLRAIALDGSSRSLVVARTAGDDVHPMLTQSGRWLFWIVDHQNIYRVPGPAQGWRAAAPEQVTSFARSGLFLEDPQLSPDGRNLLFARRERTADLWLMELAPDANK